jgi:acetyl esterase/lipase
MNYLAPVFSRVISPRWSVYKNVAYGSDPQQVGDLYIGAGGVRPLMILVHGGGWASGGKSAYEGRARRYVLAGFHVFAINYRLATFEDKSTQWPAQYADVVRAFGWAQDNASAFKIDPQRICVGGDSAGGHLCLMLGTSPRRPAAILDMFGPCDLRLMGDLICKLPLFGGEKATADACPVDLIGDGFPPTLIMHGTKDTTVSYQQAELLDYTLTKWAVKHALIPFNGGHEFADLPWWKEEWLELRGLWWIMWNMRG